MSYSPSISANIATNIGRYRLRVSARPWLFLGTVDYALYVYEGNTVIYSRPMKGASKKAVTRAIRKYFHGNDAVLEWTEYPWG